MGRKGAESEMCAGFLTVLLYPFCQRLGNNTMDILIPKASFYPQGVSLVFLSRRPSHTWSGTVLFVTLPESVLESESADRQIAV